MTAVGLGEAIWHAALEDATAESNPRPLPNLGISDEIIVNAGNRNYSITGAVVDALGRIVLTTERKMPKLLVIDDSNAVADMFKNALADYFDITHFTKIPETESDIERYDAIIVDNQGIGNRTFKSGMDFLRHYARTHLTQVIVHCSGYISAENAEWLEENGVYVESKDLHAAEKVLELMKNALALERRDS